MVELDAMGLTFICVPGAGPIVDLGDMAEGVNNHEIILKKLRLNNPKTPHFPFIKLIRGNEVFLFKCRYADTITGDNYGQIRKT